MKNYILGNCLRGYFDGNFSSLEDAWKILSYRFLKSYPCSVGRDVIMYVVEENSYGILQYIICRYGITSLEKVDESLLINCERCNIQL